MDDELRLQEAVNLFEGRDFSPIERILLSHDGTVQRLLSVIFLRPVTPVVEFEREEAEHILRTVSLRTGEIRVAKAVTVIPLAKNSEAVADLVRGREMGLGQIAAYLGIATRRRIESVNGDRDLVWRTYLMEGEGLAFRISEYFERSLYGGAALPGVVRAEGAELPDPIH